MHEKEVSTSWTLSITWLFIQNNVSDTRFVSTIMHP